METIMDQNFILFQKHSKQILSDIAFPRDMFILHYTIGQNIEGDSKKILNSKGLVKNS